MFLIILILPPLILLEFVFEIVGLQTITVYGVSFHSPVFYLEQLEKYTKILYSHFGTCLAQFLNWSYVTWNKVSTFVHSLNLPEHLSNWIVTLWLCSKKVTKTLFRTTIPIYDFHSSFSSSINNEVFRTSPKLKRSKRLRSLDLSSDITEDLTQSRADISQPILTELNKSREDITKLPAEEKHWSDLVKLSKVDESIELDETTKNELESSE